MQVNSSNPIGGAAFGQDPATPTNGVKTLGQNDFLKLLSVQMQAQDPLNPMADTEFISQMANFTSLEQMKDLTASFHSFISQQRSADAQSYLGKTVTLLDPDKGLITGTVNGVTFEEGAAQVLVGGKSYDPALITTIQLPTGGPSSATSTAANP